MASIAVVARSGGQDLEYLVSTNGRPEWAKLSGTAARFSSVRDATRVALMLPARWKAFALPIAPC